jgi:hypothetical protein
MSERSNDDPKSNIRVEDEMKDLDERIGRFNIVITEKLNG